MKPVLTLCQPPLPILESVLDINTLGDLEMTRYLLAYGQQLPHPELETEKARLLGRCIGCRF